MMYSVILFIFWIGFYIFSFHFNCWPGLSFRKFISFRVFPIDFLFLSKLLQLVVNATFFHFRLRSKLDVTILFQLYFNYQK